MKLQSRKNRTIVITMDEYSAEVLRTALDTLEYHHWQVAKAEPEGSLRELTERERANSAQRFRYALDRIIRSAAVGKADTHELTDAQPAPSESFIWSES